MFGANPKANGRTVWFIEDSTLYALMGSFGVLTGVWLVTLLVRKQPVPKWYLWLAAGGALLSGASNIARSRMMMLEADIARFEQKNQPPPPSPTPAPTQASAAIQSTNQQAPYFTPPTGA